MTDTETKIAKALNMIENAEASIKAARGLLENIGDGDHQPESHISSIHSMNAMSSMDTPSDTKAYEEGEAQIVEGYFDGQNMIGPNEKIYPVPANYASKSKLVEGDKLKLTIMPNGSFVYKQISPIDREFLKGTLTKEDGHFKVMVGDKSYRVLLASVTYYKGTVGDEVTLIIPNEKDSTWGAIEAIIPQVGHGNYNTEDSF